MTVKYKSAPVASRSTPAGIPFIVANEAAERFSYYGMRAILVVFMTQYLMNSAGESDVMTANEAQAYYHLFISAVYFMPVFGALLADAWLGKYRTILYLSLFYCFGHFALALDDTRSGLLIGLGLIAVGAGGIKPCVSSHLGDQFGASNVHLLSRIFGWFYFSINLGAFAAMLLIPWLLKQFGAAVAFAIPGLLMLFATLAFWLGRQRFIHIPASGIEFVSELFSPDGLKIILKLGSIYLFVAVFWALFEQTGSSWVIQAQKMDRSFFNLEILPSQIQAANPLMIMCLVPIFSYFIYPQLNKLIELTALKKIALGLFLTSIAFSISALIQMQIDKGLVPHISWQLLAYLLITAAEVMVSVTCLEFSYTQAPKRMKSFIMALFFMSISFGNLFTSAVNFFIINDDGSNKLSGADYFWFFTLLMLVTSVLFLFVIQHYQEKTYLHDEQLS